jgi:hypothetical protein
MVNEIFILILILQSIALVSSVALNLIQYSISNQKPKVIKSIRVIRSSDRISKPEVEKSVFKSDYPVVKPKCQLCGNKLGKVFRTSKGIPCCSNCINQSIAS